MRTLIKFILLLALIACALEFTLKGEQGAFGGALVRMGIVAPGKEVTLKDRVERNLDKARTNEAKRYGEVEEAARSGE